MGTFPKWGSVWELPRGLRGCLLLHRYLEVTLPFGTQALTPERSSWDPSLLLCKLKAQLPLRLLGLDPGTPPQGSSQGEKPVEIYLTVSDSQGWSPKEGTVRIFVSSK